MIKTKDVNIYFFGDENFKLDVNVLETWRITESSLLVVYEPLFNSYLSFVATNNLERSFLSFLKKVSPECLILSPCSFEILVDDGILINDVEKVELDCMILIDETIVAIKQNLFWVFDQNNVDDKHFFSL